MTATRLQLQHGITWEDKFTPIAHDEPCFNLGLAHGMPAIVNILAKINGVSPLVERSLGILSVSNLPGASTLYPTLVNTAGLPVTAGWDGAMATCP